MTHEKSRHAKSGDTNPLVVQHGYAKQTPKGTLRYSWDAIFDLWSAWPDSNLESFSRSWGISYSAITKQAKFSVAAKRQQLASSTGRKSFRDRVIDTITLAKGSISTNPEQMRSIIDSLLVCAEAEAKLLRSRMVKEQPDGTTIANPCLTHSEMKSYSDTLLRTTQAMKELLFLAASVPDTSSDEGSHEEPQPVIAKIGRSA